MYTTLLRASVVRAVAAIVLCSLLLEIVMPLTASALTNGPAQPEFSTFEPVGTSDMVNQFTGQFTYNLPVLSIPGPNGSGYALSLSYHSGLSAEEDASWAGFGWTLNPGAISRMKRGFPDDYNKAPVRYWSKVPENWTVTVGKKIKLETYSKEWDTLPDPPPPTDTNKARSITNYSFSINSNVIARYNNYKGYSYTFGAGIDANGWANLGFSTTDGVGSFSGAVSPARILNSIENGDKYYIYGPKKTPVMDWDKLLGRIMNGPNFQISTTSLFGLFRFGEVNMATSFPAYHGVASNYDIGGEADPAAFFIGGEVGVSGSYTYQQNVHTTDREAYGYMYSGERGDDGVMDYYDEREGPYNKRDRYLAMPFSNADIFSVNGEGIGGGFRLYNNKAGHFHPPKTVSKMEIRQISGDGHFIGTIGAGADIGLGEQTLTVDKWDGDEGSEEYRFADTGDMAVPYAFRFNNDPGGSIEFDTDDAAVRAESSSDLLSFMQVTAAEYKVPSKIQATSNNTQSRQAGFVGYNTYAEVLHQPDAGCMGTSLGNAFYKAHNKRKDIRDFFVVHDTAGPPDHSSIAEFATVNEDGDRYVYGLPVYARKERDYQFGLGGLTTDNLQHKYLAFPPNGISPGDEGVTAVGEERDRAYATAYLLTEITTPDYIDRTNDGPSLDDLGGYTKFSYERTAGTNSKEHGASDQWYKWRMPYRGLLYRKNSLSDSRDDLGSVSYGEKEIYYLKAIETKTHIAKFVLNDPLSEPRRDAYEAVSNELIAMSDSTVSAADAGNNKMRFLKRIELYAKDASGNPGTLITTVRFEYDYSLCPDIPNSELVGGGLRAGKLTLRRVYFEHGGARESRISPYEFGYEYRKSADYSSLPIHLRDTLYKQVVSHADNYSGSPSLENPSYSPFNADGWGNYGRDGGNAFNNLNFWVNQRDDALFDPAAWQLKWIRLPSGGEIDVQYEQNTYRYVQDRDAMCMVPLRNAVEGAGSPYKNDDNTYYLSLDSLGINDSSWFSGGSYHYLPEVELLEKRLDSFFVGNPTRGPHRMFFRFLYSLKNWVDPVLDNCASEYTSGHVKVGEVFLDRTNGHGLYIRFEDPDDGAYSHPQDVCRNFVRTSRQGIVENNGICDPGMVGISGGAEPDPEEVIDELLAQFGDSWYDEDDCCSRINLPHSYVRIPMFRAKKGGGVRVKRLLMYDPGIETGAAALYGTEYLYQTPDGLCSGVATNEPGLGREENALVTYLEHRDEQGEISKIISGADREQAEGPIGESLLPSASVGYSRVMTKNIHVGKTGTGFGVNEYYTVRDYPFDKFYNTNAINGPAIDHTDIDDWGPPPMHLYFGFGSVVANNLYRLQGYRYVLNSMHGRPIRSAAYVGDYSDPDGNAVLQDQQYSYFEPGESILMMNSLGDTSRAYPGKEMEVVMESRAVTDHTADAKIEMDFGLGLLPFMPIPQFGAFPSANYRDESLYTHVTTKVVRYPAIVKSVTATKDGVTSTNDYVAFNPDNGHPSLVRTYDGYSSRRGSPLADHEGSYYTYTFPASHEYPAMGQRSALERTGIPSTGGLNIDKRYFDWKHYLNFSSSGVGDFAKAMANLTSGDLVRLTSGGNDIGTYHIGRIAGNQVELLPTYIGYSDTEARQSDVTITIIRSARGNRLNAAVGSITTYGRWPTVEEHEIP